MSRLALALISSAPIARRVVDEDASLRETPKRLGDPAVVLLGQEAAPESLSIDPRIGRQQSQEELVPCHLEAKEANRLVAPYPDIGGDVEHELVLPMDGRAAMMMRSAGCNPDVRTSRSANPVATPVSAPLCSCRRSIVAKLFWTSVRSETKPSPMRSSAISKMVRSASSRSSSASSSAS